MFCNDGSILALRAKGSFYHRHQHPRQHCFSSDRAVERGSSCCHCCRVASGHRSCSAAGFPARGIFASPRFLYRYWLRQSALILWAPSRIIVSSGGGAAAGRYSRLGAACGWDPDPDGEWGRWRRCRNRRLSCRVSDGSFQDMLSLLAEAEECGREGGTSFVDAAAEDDQWAWESELSSSHRSASSLSSISGDSRSSKVFRGRGRDEGSTSYGWNDEIDEKEVREVWKHEGDSHSRRRCRASDTIVSQRDAKKRELRSMGREDNATSLMGSVHESRRQYVQKESHFTGEKESKEQLEKVARTLQVQQSSAAERNVGDKKMVNVMNEEVSAVVLLEELRRQQDEIKHLRMDYLDLLRTTQASDVNATKACSSCSVSSTKVEDSRETSTLQMSLLEEIRKQHSEIEQLNENYQKFMRAYKMQERNMIRESNSTESLETRLVNMEENSTSAVNLVEEGAVRYGNMDKQAIDDSIIVSQALNGRNQLKKNNQNLKISDIHESDIGRNSNYNKARCTISEASEKKAVSTINLVEGVESHHTNIAQDSQNIRRTDLRTNSQKLTERADIHGSSTETASIFLTRVGDRKEDTSSTVNLNEEREEQVRNVNVQASRRVDSRKNSQKLTDIVEIHNNDMTKASRIQGHVDAIVKDQKEHSTSVQHLVQLTRNKRVQIDQHVLEEININKDTRSCINVSEAFRGESHNASVTFDDQERNSASALNLVHEVPHQGNEDGTPVTQQFRLRNDAQQGAPEIFESGPVNDSDSKMLSSNGTNSGDEYSSFSFFPEAKEKQKSDLIKENFGAYSGTLGSSYSSGHVQTPESDYHTKNDGFHLVKDNVLESVRLLDKSSSHYVGEFVYQLQQKASASQETDTTSYNSPESQMGVSQSSPLQKPKATAEYENEIHKQEGPGQYSARSEVAGPSDRMWEVSGPSQEPSLPEETDKDSSCVRVPGATNAPATVSSAIIKRSSKSLWSYISDIVRFGWRIRTSSQNSTLKPNTRSSSNESVTSDAWFSGRGPEPEDDHEENVKNGRGVSWKKPELNNEAAVSKSDTRISSSSGQIASEITRPVEEIMQVELNVSIATESVGGSYESDVSPPEPGLENLVPVDRGKRVEGIPPAVTTSQSALLGSTLVSTSEEETETGRVHISVFGLKKSEGEQKTEKICEGAGLERMDAQLKRRKLQWNKQVLREEFEEWGEAYKLETEQRKMDELFMREALLEAKKAADMWEVPVGAVLVQDGKIIARGCNLVEDLRDSTAHAEMICIREASSLLRTWHLVGTTLYVTLEPCPMCAGAILQSRIDAVVWGAPNRLLGADGSWVRLFPGGDGQHSLDQSNQTVGPVHPFHPKIAIRRGVLAMECADAMQQFFQLRRKKKKPEPSPPSCPPVSYPAKLLMKMHNVFSTMACM